MSERDFLVPATLEHIFIWDSFFQKYRILCGIFEKALRTDFSRRFSMWNFDDILPRNVENVDNRFFTRTNNRM